MTLPTSSRPGRNEPCHCGSGRKYKHCCLEKDHAKDVAARDKASADASTTPAASASPTPTRPVKPRTEQPWKTTTARGFVPRMRTPRKVGGSWARRDTRLDRPAPSANAKLA